MSLLAARADTHALAGNVPAHNDMLCTLPCVSGANDTANLTRSANAPNISAGIFAPPYAINNGNEQLALNTRTMPVTASHYDGARPAGLFRVTLQCSCFWLRCAQAGVSWTICASEDDGIPAVEGIVPVPALIKLRLL